MTILVITLIPLNPNTGLGWRSKKAGEMNCKGKNGKEFIKCVEDNSYASMNMTSDEEQLYVDDLFVMSQSLQVDPGEISDDPRTTIQIPINDSLMYHIVISDPKMQWTLYEYHVFMAQGNNYTNQTRFIYIRLIHRKINQRQNQTNSN